MGTKNLLGIMTSVQCTASMANQAVPRIEKELMPQYPNVNGVVTINHVYGCGIAINAPGAAVPIRTLQNLLHNPNLGGEAFSGVSANPVVGYAADLIVRAGGAVQLSEVTEARDAILLLTCPAISR